MDIGPGTLVRCVKTFTSLYKGERGPKAGVVYTVREVATGTRVPAIRLVEIVNPLALHRDGIAEPAWAIRHFRPVNPSALDSIRDAIKTPETV